MENQEILATRQFLAFNLEEEAFAFDIAKVREVLEHTKVTKLPQMPEMMKGVINLRGCAVPIIDMRVKFGMSESEKTVNTVFIITEVDVNHEKAVIGAMVDSVSEVIDLESLEIEPPPRIGTRLNSEFISGMGKRDGQFVMILDTEAIFSADELHEVRQINEQVPV